MPKQTFNSLLMSASAEAQRPSSPDRTRGLTRLLRRSDRLLAAGRDASARFSRWRLAIFLVGAVGTITLYKAAAFHAGNASLFLFLVIFGVVARYHSRLESRMQRLQRWQTLKREHLARLSLDWANLPPRTHPAPSDHPYAQDLDLVGPTSLLRVIDTTVSTMGRERLTEWFLQQPPTLAAWQSRTRLVRELVPLPSVRDRLALAARLLQPLEVDGHRIQQALSHAVGPRHVDRLLMVEGALALLTLGLAGAALAGLFPSYWVLSLALYVFLYMWFLGDTEHLFNRAMTMRDELATLAALFARLEQRPGRHQPALRETAAPFFGARRPSAYLRRLARICSALSVRAHPLVHMMINAVGPWDLWFIRRLEQARSAITAELPQWLDRLAEIEAAAALANFAYLHPHYAWPALIESQSNSRPSGVETTGLGHPLLHHAARVANDFTTPGAGHLVLITGSNMSGKSTFLRTVGINICLAQAGAPVCAASFRWSWVRVRCCVRVTDSLDAGLSYFYAEVKRLRLLLEAGRIRTEAPVLFLIDEIFKGTNNRERLLGSRTYIEALAGTNGFGLISTHDLELAELERTIPRLTNAHFQETVAAGSLHFDYRLRPGPCTTTNALRIMALEGLPVPGESS